MPSPGLSTLVGGWVDDAAQTIARKGKNVINRAGEAVYDAKEKVSNFATEASIALGADPWEARDFPEYMRTNNPNDWETKATSRYLLGGYDPKTLPKKMPKVAAWRADPKGRFGGKDGLETRPVVFGDPMNTRFGNPAELYGYARSLAHGKKYGIPQLSSTQLAAMAIKEGRSDFGTLSWDYNNEKDYKLFKQMVHDGMTEEGARFAMAVKQKKEVSKRLGITFEEAWNGTGKSFVGLTGADYSKDFQHHLKAAKHPKNKQLVDFIQSALNAEK